MTADLRHRTDPPDPPLLRAIWHGLRNEWDDAHDIVQADGGRNAAWVHAWLHRLEGDLSNAAYWYRRAGRPIADGDTTSEGIEIAGALTVD